MNIALSTQKGFAASRYDLQRTLKGSLRVVMTCSEPFLSGQRNVHKGSLRVVMNIALSTQKGFAAGRYDLQRTQVTLSAEKGKRKSFFHLL